MKRLYVMRHAEASHDASSDHERELTDHGRMQARDVGMWMRGQSWDVDAIVASSAVRTQQTGQVVRDNLFADATGSLDVVSEPSLYNCSMSAWFDVVGEFPDLWQEVLVIGHNPAVQNLISRLAEHPVPVTVATVAEVHAPSWRDLTEGGETVAVYAPGGVNLMSKPSRN